MASDLVRGAIAGKETYLEYNTGTYLAPVWAPIPRARNIQVTNGPALSPVEFHGSANTSQIPGYSQFAGSFEYVNRKADEDTVLTALKTARDAHGIIMLRHLDGPPNLATSTGWQAPCLLGEFSDTANGGDPVVTTIPFSLADAYDTFDDSEVGVEPAAGGP